MQPNKHFVFTNGDGAPLPQARLYGDGGSVEYSFFVVDGPAVTGRFKMPELDRGKILFCLDETFKRSEFERNHHKTLYLVTL